MVVGLPFSEMSSATRYDAPGRAFRRRLDDDVRDEMTGERRAGAILVGLRGKLGELGRPLRLRAEVAVGVNSAAYAEPSPPCMSTAYG